MRKKHRPRLRLIDLVSDEEPTLDIDISDEERSELYRALDAVDFWRDVKDRKRKHRLYDQ